MQRAFSRRQALCEARCSLWVIYRIIYRLCSCRWLSGDIQTLQMGARTGQREQRVGMRTPTVGLRGACADAGAAGQTQAGRPGGAGPRSDFGPRWPRGSGVRGFETPGEAAW